MNSLVIGKLIYVCPLYMNASQHEIQKLNKVLMTAACTDFGNYCFKKEKKHILNKCNWLSIEHITLYSSLNFIHYMIINKYKESLYNLYKDNSDRRSISIHNNLQSKIWEKKKNYQTTKIYNNLPMHFKKLKQKHLKIQIKTHLKDINLPNTVVWSSLGLLRPERQQL